MLSTARLELERLMQYSNIGANVPFLLIANKMDAEMPLDCRQVRV